MEMLQQYLFNRDEIVRSLDDDVYWDIVVVGGGATGLGIAVDAASRGYKTLLVEADDFAKGTSSRSTKLVHGGVRYLAQGNFSLVYHALRERGLLFRNAPHLVKTQSFIIPCYSIADTTKYWTGLKIYDWLSGRLSFGSSKYLSRKEVLNRLPNINANGLKNGIEYFDGQFDDARLAINLAQTAIERGATVLNHCKLISLIKQDGKIKGVEIYDQEQKKKYRLQSKIVINATGVFVDNVLKMDEPAAKPILRTSQGIHLVVQSKFLNSTSAILIPKTSDGRVLFAVPWHQHLLLGTTDTPTACSIAEPKALEEEKTFVLQTLQQYLSNAPTSKDVLSVFAGLRPLVNNSRVKGSTKEISRDHKLIINPSGLITITGGKWTTYRQMAEETVNNAIQVGGLELKPCVTKKLPIHGSTSGPVQNHLAVYGADANEINNLMKENPALSQQLIQGFAHTKAEVVWAVRFELARTVEDVLARRLRILFLNTQAAIDAAPVVASILQKELNKDDEWVKKQIESFNGLAQNYLM